MDLGSFSISLSVKNIEASRDFYAELGFEPIGGNVADNWLVLRNRDHVIGLFQGMFESNILTFNPGWDQQCNQLDSFGDVRELQQLLKERGIVPDSEADESTTGPASMMLTDPDGKQILIDQHV
jgi:lactoylglutathione lyase